MDASVVEIVLKGGAVASMGLGAIADIRGRRIPNLITLGGAVIGLAVNTLVHQQQGAVSSLTGWAAGVALLAIPFVLGGLGAGDVKLLALAGAWGGPSFALYTFLFGAIVGGVVAVGLLLVRARESRAYRAGAEGEGAGMPALTPDASRSEAVLEGGGVGADGSPAVASLKMRFAYGPALALGGLVALLVR